MAITSNPLLPIFVGEKTNSKSKMTIAAPASGTKIVTRLPQSLELAGDDRAVLYFFTSFSRMNVLAGNTLIDNEILNLAKTSPALRDAMVAVATLHRMQQEQFRLISTDGQCDKHGALQAYGRSVRCIQNRITSNTFLCDPSALWTTFLLGLFEVRSQRSSLLIIL
jgi:hypothetical protein